MKSICLLPLVLFVAIAVTGCGGSEDTSLATEGASADDLAAYEAKLEAVSGGDSYEDDADDDAE